MLEKRERSIFRCVQFAVVAVFVGRAYQHIWWDAPYRTLLWDEEWMKGIVQNIFSIDWKEWISSLVINDRIDGFVKGTGWFYLVCAIVALFIRRLSNKINWLLLVGAASLTFLAFLYFKEKFYNLGQFLEYSLQFSCPIFLWYMVKTARLSRSMIFWFKMAIALTFICHGLYAVGYYPQPGYFIQMILNILGVGEETAIFLLKGMGYLDFLVSVLIFFPPKIAKPALLYAIFWGFATAFARIWSGIGSGFFLENLHQNWFESLYRFPHFLIPFAVYLWYSGLNNKELKLKKA